MKDNQKNVIAVPTAPEISESPPLWWGFPFTDLTAEAMDPSRNAPESLTSVEKRLWEAQCDSAMGKSTGALPIAVDADVLNSRG